MFAKLIVFSLLLLMDGLAQTQLLPDFITPCTDDPNLVKCPSQILAHQRERLLQGIPELQMPPIDPLILPQAIVSPRGSTLADYTANITNMVWTGVGGYEILETFLNTDALVFRIKLRFPFLHVTADVLAYGWLLGYEMRGAGDFSCNSTNVVLDIILNGQRYERDGREFLRWKEEDVSVEYDDFYFIHLHGLFDDPTRTQLFMVAMNKGIRLISTSAKGLIVKSIGSFITESINRVHSLYPSEVLYLNP